MWTTCPMLWIRALPCVRYVLRCEVKSYHPSVWTTCPFYYLESHHEYDMSYTVDLRVTLWTIVLRH